MEMRRIEVTEEGGFLDGAVKREFGDVFSSLMGGEYIRLGWAKDFETGETGERKIGVQNLQVDNFNAKNFK